MAAGQPRISLIVAMSRNRVIGRNNAIPWRIPAELARFKQLTMGHHIVMGRKSWESIGRLLPGRTTVIVTRNPDLRVQGALIAASLPQALGLAAQDEEIFVIGGAEIFRLALPLAQRIYLTTVEIDIEGDTFMPHVDPAAWRCVSSESHPPDATNPLAWVLEIYHRVAGTEHVV
ncbi:MAG: dihydrofolate reductase [Betaproteobacteria bacterium]|nr:dihydrofolate reductase [Betaproteobacteria bacterium]